MITDQCNKHATPSYHKKVVAFATEMAEALMLEHGHEFDLLIKTKRGGRSWGGVKHISIGDQLDKAKRKHKFVEYKSIRDSKTIGSVEGDQDTCLRALVAHEIAHWWHHNLLQQQHGERWWDHMVGIERPHGQRWQMIYRDLRAGL